MKALDEFTVFLQELTGEYEREQQRLEAEERRDEADQRKISRNICLLCREAYEELSAQKNGTVLKTAYLERLRTMAAPWSEAEEKARLHRDVAKMLPQSVKLKTINRIRLGYLAIGRKLP